MNVKFLVLLLLPAACSGDAQNLEQDIRPCIQANHASISDAEDMREAEAFLEKGYSSTDTANVAVLLVNSRGDLLLDGESTSLEMLCAQLKPMITHGIGIHLQSEKMTAYVAYLAAYNQIKSCYAEFWEAAAIEKFNQGYDELSEVEKAAAKAAYPLRIIESNPK